MKTRLKELGENRKEQARLRKDQTRLRKVQEQLAGLQELVEIKLQLLTPEPGVHAFKKGKGSSTKTETWSLMAKVT